ncbi:metal-dependent hydrolase [Desulforamulus hydrothermalis]|uniref:UPF0173 metal-dependent hydrolase DESHY_110078 n=1 Tax=Desulforamulus hydrothermalis Lam5 = DSM 18033 TaxID=1121428 RepID=K8DX79_9FIRM|nr:metal-dependent hydrolase [Desulforamulus hydrothermalis]CCO07134.1 conserved hypothetical protein [Desulforamulus hydrothermalis Lam5 = DSM 18033]SHG89341.1 L-ascorbate metabolism protein UlaG, beta-lactamase superfamily [Desulforamulus hydrothermalis Lam5 = DSM 18033]
MRLTFLGHAAFLLATGEVTIAVDPFMTGNPAAPDLPVQADYIMVSHGHADHLGDAVTIARQSGGTVVAVYELANHCARQGAKVHAMHIGGSHDFGYFKVKLTPALHGSSLGSEQGPAEYLGNPCGFLITVKDKTIYHAGDTGLFGDMALLGRLHNIDAALLPIGDNFTMGPADALEAVKLLQPRLVVPMHYNTWPLIAQQPAEFKKAVEEQTAAQVIILQPGESFAL